MTQVDRAGEIAGGYGKAIPLRKGQKIKLVNTPGTQVVDTWALNLADTSEYLSMEHTRRMTRNLFPQVGDILYSNRRTEMLCLEEDTSPGHHDTMVACCDKWLYKHYGCEPGHRNCRDNFLESVFEAGFDATTAPNPLNLWMNFPVSNNRNIDLGTPLSKAGDYVVLTALIDCLVVFSACPMDITPINGDDRTAKAVHYTII
ncbi:urea carboxylase-associated family protein [bacterium M00.F.Ca.ET.194.01.1.1]|nr:urea carboxylase-associated family protein [bacterium M00.F.Ca.ET.194.01.1.1]TGS52326.1 urea carboxylase-associated family protein [bacterium M00.F.Ca.ET.179.01.1.1]TGV44187.1 urea carboxylase-associated family protein [bacterium M00.F.Ca.ET.168.01.1.1]